MKRKNVFINKTKYLLCLLLSIILISCIAFVLTTEFSQPVKAVSLNVSSNGNDSFTVSTDFQYGFSGTFTCSDSSFFNASGTYSGCTRISGSAISISGNAFYTVGSNLNYTFNLSYSNGTITVLCRIVSSSTQHSDTAYVPGSLSLTSTYDSYTVTFNLDGGQRDGGGALTQTVLTGNSATAPIVSRANYTFVGWDKPLSNIRSNVTITALWVIKSYTVTFNANGGTISSGNAIQTINHGENAVPPVVSRTGYTFTGWSGVYTNITSDVTIIAQWSIDSFTVRFDLNGGTLVSGSLTQNINYGSAASAPTTTYTGYIFTGWDRSFNYITSSITVTAQWRKIAETTATVQTSSGTIITSGATNQSFKYVAVNTDGISRCEYRTPNSNTWQTYTNGTVIPATSTFGAYSFRAYNIQGAVSSVTEITLLVVTDFGNYEQIYNSYKVTSWYVVSLPARVFNVTGKTDISGSYSFATYAQAENYAIEKETAYRVTVTEGGWIYVSATNESVFQVYTDRAALDKVILAYAKKYISAEQRYKYTGSNNYYTPMTPSGVADLSALTMQNIKLPSFLSSYSSYKLSQCPSGFTFTKYRNGNISLDATVTLKFLANDISVVSGNTVTVAYNQTIKQALTAAGNYLQGYYLVTEKDIAGNTQSYLIYIDIEAPSLVATVTTGTTQKQITFNTDYITQWGSTNCFISFNINSFIDTADPYTCVYISGRNIDGIFLTADEIPTLTYSDGYYGTYTITIYDRSKNSLVFDIYIAGAEPSWSYTSLSNDTRLTITVTLNDRNNAITNLELYKIKSDGEYVPIETDDDGTVIDFMTLSYILRTGGKYTIRVSDLYGRTIEFEPIFYKKGLPQGTLSGVNDGGRTNKEVTFKYPAGNTLIVYIFQSGNKVIYENHTTIFQNSNNTYTVTFIASEVTSHEYLLFLHNSDDIGLFIEYRFEISCIMPEISIIDANGKEIPFNGATSGSFYITWNEVLAIRYYSSSSIGGSLSSSSYKKGTVLTVDSIYYFSVTDEVGNKTEFTVQIKTTIKYEIKGNYVNLSGRIAANNALTLTVIDAFTQFNVTSNNGYTFSNGGQITYDGVYTVTVVDVQGNRLVLTIEINRTLPYLQLIGTVSGGSTNNSVSVLFDDTSAEGYLVNQRGTIIAEITNGFEFTQHGTYSIKIVDYIGNTSTASFSIDLAVDWTSSVINGQMTTDKVSFVFSEDLLSCTVMLDGEEIEYNKNFTQQGLYTIFAEDFCGNILEFRFEIQAKRYKAFYKELTADFYVKSIKLGGNFVQFDIQDIYTLNLQNNGEYEILISNDIDEYILYIEIDNVSPTVTIKQDSGAGGSVKITNVSKKNVTYTLIKDSIQVEYTGKAITELGSYKLTVSDDLGNISVYDFVIEYRFNVWSIVVLVIAGLALVIAIIVFIRARGKIKVK